MKIIAKEIFLTKGVGYHKDKLTSFEEALRKAQIARFNLVDVSSILPPKCKIVPVRKGLEKLESGQILFVVKARNETNEYKRLVSSSIGVAVPRDRNLHGYLSEHHAFGETATKSGDYAEDLAAEMLATTLGIEFNPDEDWDKKREIWRISGKMVATRSITAAATCPKNGIWTTTVAAAVLVT